MNRLATVYRVLAWVVGINLLLVMAGFIGQLSTGDTSWFNRNDGLISFIDIVHGYLFMALVVIIAILGRRHRWSPWFIVSTMLFATIPFVSFWAERRASKALTAAAPAG